MYVEEEKEEKKAKFSLIAWRRLFPCFKPARRAIIWTAVIMAFTAATDVILPVLQSYMIADMVEVGSSAGIVPFIALYGAVILSGAFAFYVVFRLGNHAETSITKHMRDAVFKKFQTLPLSYFNDRSVGYLVAKTVSDTDQLSGIAWDVVDISWSLVYLIGLFIPLFITAPGPAAALLALVPPVFLITLFSNRKLLKLNRAIRRANSLTAGALNEGITGAKTAKTLNASEVLEREFRALTKSQYDKTYAYNRLFALYVSVLGVMGACAAALVIFAGGNSYFGGNISIAGLSLFLSYSFSFFWPVRNIANIVLHIVSNQANAERVAGILDEKDPFADKPEVVEKYGDEFTQKRENYETITGEIEFKNVSFRYPGSETYILKNFNLVIPAGTKTAFVGETGAGKTTAANLLCRFYEPEEGEILIDGKDYRERSKAWLYANLGYVLQTPHLFSGTVRDNIRFGKPDASDAETEEAARAARCDKIIARLPKGFDTEVGECGDNLSMGERQLVAIARAVIADPRIFVLDEATACVDSDTERLVQEAADTLLAGRTSLVIAHRLSTVKNADNIAVIENGGIAEMGSHAELMKKRGRYYELYTRL